MTLSTGETHDTPESRRYNRIHRRLSLIDLGLGVAMLIVLLAAGWSGILRDWAVHAARQNYLLALFFYVGMLSLASKLLGLPLDFYSFRLEHRFQLSNQSARSWAWDEVKSWLVTLVLGALLAEIIYFAIRRQPQYWWLIAWGIFIFLTVIFAQLAPVLLFPLFYKFKPLENEDLKQRLLRLSERAGANVRGVYEWKLSEKSKKANAALTGLGNTRRIILADTLLQNYSADEIESILAHELGHHVHRHMLKGIFVQVAISFVGFWAAGQLLNWAIYDRHLFPALADFADLPLLVLVSSVISLLLLPAMNAWSRYNERQADRYCWQSTPSVEPFITSMTRLADQNLAEREPSRLVEIFFHSHPPIPKRIRAAQEFARSRAQDPAG
jgi:STE24 endopeptidase